MRRAICVRRGPWSGMLRRSVKPAGTRERNRERGRELAVPKEVAAMKRRLRLLLAVFLMASGKASTRQKRKSLTHG